MSDLCPRCAKREIEPGAPSGWCADCVIEDLREKYATKTRAAMVVRGEAWASRSAWDRDRQRVHRLKDVIKPKDPLDHRDPWELAYEALVDLGNIRTVRMRAEQVARLDRIAEALRRLAWGPDDMVRSNVISMMTRRRLRGRPQIPGQLSLFPELVSEAA